MVCLCFFTVVGVAVVVAAIAVLIALVRSDGDLVLMLKAKYGKQPDSLAGKVVWITGASSGIGEYLAYCLAEAGSRLVLSARRLQELERVKLECLRRGGSKISEADILVLPLDIVAFDTHKAAVQKVMDTFNKIDILVNNAGRGQRALWLEVDLQVDKQLFDINVFGTVSLTQEVLPYMIQRRQGHMVAVSSVAGKLGAPTNRSYTASKHALQGYFESLRTEMGVHNIDVTLICPGPVVSDISSHAVAGKPGESIDPATRQTYKRMPTERCAYLSCVAIANKSYEAWISDHPPLFLLYVYQYFPDLGRWVSKKWGMKIVESMRSKQ